MKMTIFQYLKGKRMKNNKIVRLIVIITVILILVDQLVKILIKANYEKPIEGNIIGITLIENTGMAFGFNSGNTKNIVLTLLILLLILNFVRNQKERMDTKTAIAIGLILAGGFSNLIDRITRGGILDFIDVKNFAVLNLADCYIFIGWIFLIVVFVKFNREMVGRKNCEKR